MVPDTARGVSAFRPVPCFPGHYATPMASEDQLLAAAAAAKPFAAAGEAVVGRARGRSVRARARVPVRARAAGEVDDDRTTTTSRSSAGSPSTATGSRSPTRGACRRRRCSRRSARRPRRPRSCPTRPRSREAAERALALGGESRPELRAALEATREAALAAAAHGDGLRVARTGYVDELADAARGLGAERQALQQRGAELSAGLSGEALDPAEPLARAVWDVLERIAAAGAPEHFSEALGDAAPAISAFAEDVLAHYRAELDDAGGAA